MRKPYWTWLIWIALAAAVLLWLARAYVGRIALDDAYITDRYARHLAEAGTLRYNLAQPENATFWSQDGKDFEADVAALERLAESGTLRDDATGICLKIKGLM